jgi:hypothetical protein
MLVPMRETSDGQSGAQSAAASYGAPSSFNLTAVNEKSQAAIKERKDPVVSILGTVPDIRRERP